MSILSYFFEDAIARAAMGIHIAPPAKTLGSLIEWECKDEVTGVDTSITDEFIKEAIDRWAIGVDEYRGGDDKLPFAEDPLAEGITECLDLYCYSKEARKQDLLSDTESDMVNCHALDAYKILKRVMSIRDSAKD